MKLLIKALGLKNFKGIKQFSMMFDNTEVKVYGANGSGKTTLVDAFMWLLFDKDSQDRKDFEIKTLDKENNPIHFLDHEVIGTFELNGGPITLAKKLNEKWVKKRGQSQQEFSGHETTYYIDGVPCKKTEFQKWVDEIINEKTFKLLTNPLAFEAMKWQDKRKILFEVCGNIEDQSVPGYDQIQSILGNKDIDTLKKSLAATKKKLKQDIENIPPRIDELKKMIIEAIDKGDVLSQIAEKKHILEGLNIQLEASNSQFDIIRGKQQQLLSLERTKEELTRKHNQDTYAEHNKLKHELEHMKFTLNNNQSEITKLNSLIEVKKKDNVLLNAQVDVCRKEWQELKNETFDEHKKVCPTCGQELPEDKLEELISRYQSDKVNQLERIVKAADAKKIEVAKNEEDIKEYSNMVERLDKEASLVKENIEQAILKLEQPIESIPLDTTEIDAQLDVIKREISNFEQVDNTAIRERINCVQREIDAKNLELAKIDEQEKTIKRISELEKKLKELQCTLADSERQEILVEDFTRAKVDMLESNINSKFESVKFKLFDEQINGGLVECCESLIDGVPFSNANNAAKVAAGIDIINVLSEHYMFYAPIWLDNRESITNIPQTQSQVVNLIVSEKDKELRVGDDKCLGKKERDAFTLDKKQFMELISEEHLEFEHSGKKYSLVFEGDTGWDDEGKYSYSDYIYKDELSGSYYRTGVSRSGSYFSDYVYTWEWEDSFSFVETWQCQSEETIWG